MRSSSSWPEYEDEKMPVGLLKGVCVSTKTRTEELKRGRPINWSTLSNHERILATPTFSPLIITSRSAKRQRNTAIGRTIESPELYSMSHRRNESDVAMANGCWVERVHFLRIQQLMKNSLEEEAWIAAWTDCFWGECQGKYRFSENHQLFLWSSFQEVQAITLDTFGCIGPNREREIEPIKRPSAAHGRGGAWQKIKTAKTEQLDPGFVHSWMTRTRMPPMRQIELKSRISRTQMTPMRRIDRIPNWSQTQNGKRP